MSKGLDSPKSLAAVVADLVKDGYGFAARYYFSHSAFKDVLTYAEAYALSKAGLYVVSVWENGYPTTDAYFTAGQGRLDGVAAYNLAIKCAQPSNTVIYFAVDGDVTPSTTNEYFKALRTVVPARYKLGVYGSGAVGAHLTKAGLADHAWLSQSKGWSGYESEKPNANIVQGVETKWHGIDVDLDTSGGDGGGWKLDV